MVNIMIKHISIRNVLSAIVEMVRDRFNFSGSETPKVIE